MFKNCKQCGELKPATQYRKYYGGRKGSYNTCKFCEKVNSREKYLSHKENPTPEDLQELEKIYVLWKHQAALGLTPPKVAQGRSVPLADSLDSLIDTYAQRVTELAPITHGNTAPPAELIKWLTEELTEEPDYYLDEVYEELQAKYRPQLRIDPATLLPVYDDTYRETLQQIIARFDAYEDSYYDKD